jgi:hypothetical protein
VPRIDKETPPVGAEFSGAVPVKTGESYVKVNLTQPIILATVVVICFASPSTEYWHERAVFVIHVDVPHGVFPNRSDGVVEASPNSVPQRVKVAPTASARFNCVT